MEKDVNKINDNVYKVADELLEKNDISSIMLMYTQGDQGLCAGAVRGTPYELGMAVIALFKEHPEIEKVVALIRTKQMLESLTQKSKSVEKLLSEDDIASLKH